MNINENNTDDETEDNTDEVVDLLSSLHVLDKKRTGLLMDLNTSIDEEKLNEGSDVKMHNEHIDNKYNTIPDIEDMVDIKHEESETVINMTKDKDNKIVDDDKETDFFDPEQQFRRQLQDAGIRNGIKAISDTFFNGEIDNPEWLWYVLAQAGITRKHRNLVVMSYYGQPPEELGITDKLSTNKYFNSTGKTRETDEMTALDEEVLKAERDGLQSAKRAFALKKIERETMMLDQQLDLIRNPKKDDTEVKTRIVQRPMFNTDGEMMKDQAGNVIAERITEPISSSSGNNSDMFTMMTVMMNMIDKKNTNTTVQDPAIGELKQMVLEMANSNREQIHRAEVDRLQSEKSNLERDFRDKLQRIEDDAKARFERQSLDNSQALKDLKLVFEDKLQQRDQLGQIASNYEKQLDEMKEIVRQQTSTVKESVVKQTTNTVDKMTNQVNNIVESAIGPFAEMMKEQYKMNMELNRHNLGLTGSAVPETSDDELKEYIVYNE